MPDITKRFLWISIYAIAMALFEAVVVVYIRGLLNITNDHVVLGSYVTMELWREVATLVMLVAVGWLAGRRPLERFAYGLFAFGLWDIWYYIWLKVWLGWPRTLFDWDTLFLLPFTWWGPVLSPVLIATLLCVSAVLTVLRLARGERLGFTPIRRSLTAMGALLALYVFMSDSLHAYLQGRTDWSILRPEPFKWSLFLIALVLMAWPTLMAVWPWSKADPEARIPVIKTLLQQAGKD